MHDICRTLIYCCCGSTVKVPLISYPFHTMMQNLPPIFWNTAVPLFRTSWVEHIWVLQDAVLMKHITFLCGKHEICFATLSKAATEEFSGSRICETQLPFYRRSIAARRLLRNRDTDDLVITSRDTLPRTTSGFSEPVHCLIQSAQERTMT